MTIEQNQVVIASFARTPIGNFQGCLSPLSATELGSIVIKGVLSRAELPGSSVDEVLMGCVLPAGLGQAPARRAALDAGLPESVGCTTINKMCGSGMQAIMLGHDMIKAGSADIVVAGGMESMSNAPYLLPKARKGLRIGHGEIQDHMFVDGLEDPHDKRLMGCYAEDCAEKYDLSRQSQDNFAQDSLRRAKQAIVEGCFVKEIEPVNVRKAKEPYEVTQDEQPQLANIEKIPKLRPAFKPDGTVTAANSSSISDGAAAVLLMTQSTAEKLSVRPVAKILAHKTYAAEPSWFTTAPVYAIKNLMTKMDMQTSDFDLFEINEAFAVVTLAAIKELDLPVDRVNIHGGACALGHPIGASGARIVATLLSALDHHGLKRGLASLCIGGGEATALAIEKWPD